MKLGFEIIYGLIVLALVVFSVRAFRQEQIISKNIKWVMCFAILAVAANIVQIASSDRLIANIAFGAYFACIDWLLALLLWFANEYCRAHVERFIKPWIIFAICFADTIQLLLNPLFGHAYRLRMVLRDREAFWTFDVQGVFIIHLLFSYFLVAVIVILLLKKFIRMPDMYRAKYLNILLILCIVVLLNALHLLTKTVVDFSVLGFPVAALTIYYYAMEYVPRALVNKTLGMTVDEMMDGLIIMDADNSVIYANNCIKQMLNMEIKENNQFYEQFCQWCREHYQSPEENFTYDWTIEDPKGGRRYLKVQYRYLLDEKDRRVGHCVSMQERTEEVLALLKERHAANHDYLTGLYNREYFYKQVERCLRLHPDEKYLMICTDVRNFKMVNDVFGAEAADQILFDIAAALRSQAISGEIYGRLVNDRFALLMRKRDYREVKFINTSAEIMKITNDVSYPLQVYIGVYEIEDPALPVSVMCDRAMMAIATIKGDYQKQVAYYDDKLRSNVLQEQELAVGLDRAIEQGEIEMYIQPQITADGRCLGGEGLVRWNHPTKGLLMPGTFISSFERNGMIVKLDRHIWELACKQLRNWKDRGFTDRYISVNISPKDFFFVDVFKEFTTLVKRYAINPRNLKLEITESAMMVDLPKQLVLIKKLREAGFLVEMDDFGSGYSSLNMLKDIHVDVLKIDMAFLRKSESEERSRTILRMIVALSKELGMPVITEGVETKDHVDFLKEIGCDMFQGYFFAKPMTVADYEKRYMSSGK